MVVGDEFVAGVEFAKVLKYLNRNLQEKHMETALQVVVVVVLNSNYFQPIFYMFF